MNINSEAKDLLKKDYELGIYTLEEYKIELEKLDLAFGIDDVQNEIEINNYSLVGKGNNAHLKIFTHVELIGQNIKPIAKMILENKWGQKNVNEDKIIVVNGTSPKSINIYSITYINVFGQFISIDLNDIVSYLDKIDFDEN